MADETEEKGSSYNKKYYEENREELLAKKAKRYREDPDYQAQIKERSAARKKRLAQEKRAKGIKPKRRQPYKPRIHTVEINGEDREVEMFTLGRLAMMLDRKIGTLRLWESKGILPQPLYRDGRGVRLYTALQVQLILKAWREVKREHGDKLRRRLANTEFPAALRQIWEDYPLGVDLNATEE